jgi:hypothetical protein
MSHMAVEVGNKCNAHEKDDNLSADSDYNVQRITEVWRINFLPMLNCVDPKFLGDFNSGALFLVHLTRKALLRPGRIYIREGSLMKMCRKGLKQRHFFLFNDILVRVCDGLSSKDLWRGNHTWRIHQPNHFEPPIMLDHRYGRY